MAGHRFGRADGDLIRMFSEYLFDCACLAQVTDVRRSGMRIDIIHLIWGYAGMLERQLHGARGAFAIRRWRRHMVGVGRKTVSRDFAVNFCAARLGMFQFFHHHDSSTFAHHKAVAVTIEWPGSALGLVVTRAERSHR